MDTVTGLIVMAIAVISYIYGAVMMITSIKESTSEIDKNKSSFQNMMSILFSSKIKDNPKEKKNLPQ